jgi:hypothetical protein
MWPSAYPAEAAAMCTGASTAESNGYATLLEGDIPGTLDTN